MTPKNALVLGALVDPPEGFKAANASSVQFGFPLNAVTDSFAICGKKRTGKSNTAVVFCEALYDAGLPFVVLDPKGDWWGMRAGEDGSPKGGLPIPIFGGEHGDYPLRPDAGAYMAQLIVEHNLTCILDVSEFTQTELRRFTKAFLSSLYKLNPKTPRMVVLEEAQEIAPQNVMSGRGDDGDAEMVGAVKRFVKLGGFKGLGTCLVSQRFADVNKGVTTQVETLIVHRTTGPQDKKAIKDWVSGAAEGAELVDSLTTLDNGEAWVWSPQFLKSTTRVAMRRRRTFDSGATPEVGAARRVATLADIGGIDIEGAMATAIEHAKATDPAELRKAIAERDKAIRDLQRQLDERPTEQVAAEPVEVPVLSDFDRTLMEDLAQSLHDVMNKIAGTGRPAAAPVRAPKPAPSPRAQPARPAAAPVPLTNVPASAFVKVAGPPAALPPGEAKVLKAIAMYDDGVERDDLTVLTGYKKSSRDQYVSRLSLKGLVRVEGRRAVATEAGIEALGGDFEPLPTGDDLRAYWLNRLPPGEAAILNVLVDAYPDDVARTSIDEATGYKKSSRDQYISRLGAKRLVVVSGAGLVRAPDTLFG